MLKKLTVRDFKSLRDVTVELPRLAVLFGPNAAGKSNLMDAIHAMSWIGNARTLFETLGEALPVRGHSFEVFSLAPSGLPKMLRRGSAKFTLEADLTADKTTYRYRIEPEIEFQVRPTQSRRRVPCPTGRGRPAEGDPCDRARRLQPPHPSERETGSPSAGAVGLNHSLLSDRSLSGAGRISLAGARSRGIAQLAHLLL